MKSLRSLLFGKWFFAILLLVSLFDVAADIAERLRLDYWLPLNSLSIAFSVIMALLAGWMFLDLHTRRSC